MLDPFTSLSLAASVVQFIDAGSKLVSKSCQIHRTGTLAQNFDLETVTSDFLNLNSDIHAQCGSSATNEQYREDSVSFLRLPVQPNSPMTYWLLPGA